MLNDSVGADMLALLNERARAYAEEKRKLLETIETLENTMDEVESIINFSEKWKNAGFEEKKAVCHLLIEKIYINEDGSAEVVWKI